MMYSKTEPKSHLFFSEPNPTLIDKRYVDFNVFKIHTLNEIKQLCHEEAYHQWRLFCEHIQQFSDDKSQKLLLMTVAFKCLDKPIESGQLSQLITLMRHVKSVYGLQMIHKVLKADVPPQQRILQQYLHLSQLLIDLHEQQNSFEVVNHHLPNLDTLITELRRMHTEYLARQYPERPIDTVIDGFGQQDAVRPFLLSKDELTAIKQDYLGIKQQSLTLAPLPQEELTRQFHAAALDWRNRQISDAKQVILAIIAETIRRQYAIYPYDTQLITVLALLNTPEKYKGRIGQIKTGEGKSTIHAILNAFMAGQAYFVDVVTSSDYLAIRDCKKYQPLYQALGLTASHICHDTLKQEHFNAQILYGTNTAFEFALLREGLYHLKLRYSYRNDGQLIPRPFDVVVIDEVDNLLLDTALNCAQLGITDDDHTAWIYLPIAHFIQTQSQHTPLTLALMQELRAYIRTKINHEEHVLDAISDKRLARWYHSACIAFYEKKENRDYIIKAKQHDPERLDITIVDYANTGRTNEGSQWQYGIHQFLQIKHDLPLSPPTKTAASISHPAYFTAYQHLLGLTGTMGEAIEREEIQAIYRVDSFDVPPTFPSQRKRYSDCLLPTNASKWDAILDTLIAIQKKEQPALVLFKTIEESNAFSAFLRTQSLRHQVLNTTQKEAEEYVISQAGETKAITIATNTAGRGTDILLSPESKQAGGLEVIFSFYPDNLRVEEQGLGRAGRQGQPGGARIIVSLEDDTIVTLINDNHPSTKPSFGLLKHYRSCRIQQESQQRWLSSQREKTHYQTLNDFFCQLSAIYDLVDSASFQQILHDICLSNQYYEPSHALFSQKNREWQDLHTMANALLEKQIHHLSVDWSAFLERFKKTYLHHIRSIWASYYTLLKDDMEEDTQDKAKKDIEQCLNAPLPYAKEILHAILAAEILVLAQQEQRPLP